MLRFGEPDADQSLDPFLGQCLFRAGGWSFPREGDGIARLRVVECTGTRVRLNARVWMIDGQRQETFWLDLPGPEEHVLDSPLRSVVVRLGAPRDLKDAIDLMNAPEQGTWRVVLTGTALVDDGVLRVVEVARAER